VYNITSVYQYYKRFHHLWRTHILQMAFRAATEVTWCGNESGRRSGDEMAVETRKSTTVWL